MAQLGPTHQLGIFEAGISRRGEMERLEPMIRPTIGVFTNIGEAHSEGFGSLAEKAAEKLKLFAGAEVLVYCGDQEETVKAVEKWRGRREAGDGMEGYGADARGCGRGVRWTDAAVRVSGWEKGEGCTNRSAAEPRTTLVWLLRAGNGAKTADAGNRCWRGCLHC